MTETCNPWLGIPLGDYEGHMALPEIAQAQMLANQLRMAAEMNKPRSLALIGCAGGNGLESIIGGSASRIVGIDINPSFVETTYNRFRKHFPRLQLYAESIENLQSTIEPVDMIFAGLVLEYVDVHRAIQTMRALCASNGKLMIVLQNPGDRFHPVSPSPYASLKRLGGFMQLRSADEVISAARETGFAFLTNDQITLSSGKEFSTLTFSV
jgi:hypothetical protein